SSSRSAGCPRRRIAPSRLPVEPRAERWRPSAVGSPPSPPMPPTPSPARRRGRTDVEIGIGLAALVALLTNLASLLKHRGCQQTQTISLNRPLSSIRGLARSRWFVAGWALAALAWFAHIAALSLDPISLVQAVLAGGAVALAVLSQRLFGDHVERRQWLALG